MIVKLKVQSLLALLLLATIALQSCAAPMAEGTGVVQGASTPGEIPTWTPRPQDLTLTALPTATRLAPVSEALTVTPTKTTVVPAPTQTPKQVTFAVEGGNMNLRRGPSVDYNYVGVIYDGETAVAIARDRISRWVLIELPSQPGVRGWVTTETSYSIVRGDVSILPFVTVEPASPAYIRNCTRHEMLIMPVEVQLLSKVDEPYNEERFGVGLYQVYDVEDPEPRVIQDISLSEGRTVDILYDWSGEKSKCQ